MLSSRPYLLRALYEWIVDSGLTPHLLVDAQQPGVEVPESAVEDGRVILNVNPSAVRDLLIDAELVTFVARFGGVSQAVTVPVEAVEAIYARENGRGMMFPPDGEDPGGPSGKEGDESTEARSPSPGPRGKPNLKVIK
ncbi:ClpXP protease specificity-enhancing factor [Wenzhouxiangella sp. AB-CW3]|uniref:ClpXP protease specificity-enhancing factor n=1 Tax=Wenzhouxiangella sp. AB-CW3 TaxID=2771012 RepID=UPI00168AD2A5|nr:ClpXP protease specificity-enhancing factor [Wenzhouxiangella sp. AB-CW3]QOC23672.1 ClpXP protease specificity-enhancing factor [Wenzhouxiangella sp. AB-CW3]